MNILIVTAHPSSKGDTHTIANTYRDAKVAKGHDVKIVDLYSDEYKVDLFRFENIREFQIPPVQKKFHEQIQWAHELVLVHPIWWGVPPSIMKNWAELTFWPGVAYKYTPDGKVNRLLLGKTAKIFATSDGPSWYYHFLLLPLKSFWELCLLGFCGIDVIDLKVCGNMDKWKGEKREKHFQNFLKKIKNS
jgi:putative NADPH-quinone reductase